MFEINSLSLYTLYLCFYSNMNLLSFVSALNNTLPTTLRQMSQVLEHKLLLCRFRNLLEDEFIRRNETWPSD